MKTLIISFLLSIGTLSPLAAQPQSNHIQEAYKSRGEQFLLPLYWLPETRDAFREHIPNHEQWVGFEQKHWAELADEKKNTILDSVGIYLDKMEPTKLNNTWSRIWDWQTINTQLELCSRFAGSKEEFLDLAYTDPILRPAFDWIKQRRASNFDLKQIGSTFSAGEMTLFIPVMIDHLLNATEKKQMECFANLFSKIAEQKQSKAEQGAAPNP